MTSIQQGEAHTCSDPARSYLGHFPARDSPGTVTGAWWSWRKVSMGYLSDNELREAGFRSIGANVRVSDKASIYDTDRISIGDNSRIDDFCVVSGSVEIGRNCHLTVFCNLAGGRAGIVLEDFVTLAYGCHVLAQSDDYSGRTMTNSTVPAPYKSETIAPVVIRRHSILGTKSIVLPGVEIAEGTSAGAATLFLESTLPWSIYVGSPARRIKDRSRNLLALEARYLAEDKESDSPSRGRARDV
jgi:acetyltransferase-like isoleucine patch superfamily enzyme